MYYRSVIVFVLCTVFVASFYAVISYDTSGVGKQSHVLVTTRTPCYSPPACETLTITSVSLRTVSYVDELGGATYATLTLGLEPAGPSFISRVDVFIGNMSTGQVQGPFEQGTNKVVSLTIPATIPVSRGGTYVVSVEGLYGGASSVWNSTRVTAE